MENNQTQMPSETPQPIRGKMLTPIVISIVSFVLGLMTYYAIDTIGSKSLEKTELLDVTVDSSLNDSSEPTTIPTKIPENTPSPVPNETADWKTITLNDANVSMLYPPDLYISCARSSKGFFIMRKPSTCPTGPSDAGAPIGFSLFDLAILNDLYKNPAPDRQETITIQGIQGTRSYYNNAPYPNSIYTDFIVNNYIVRISLNGEEPTDSETYYKMLQTIVIEEYSM